MFHRVLMTPFCRVIMWWCFFFSGLKRFREPHSKWSLEASIDFFFPNKGRHLSSLPASTFSLKWEWFFPSDPSSSYVCIFFLLTTAHNNSESFSDSYHGSPQSSSSNLECSMLWNKRGRRVCRLNLFGFEHLRFLTASFGVGRAF